MGYTASETQLKAFAALFVDDNDFTAGTIASDTGAGTVTTATLGFTPDFVVFSVENDSAAEQYWSTTSTTLTITGRSTTTAGTISYIAGNLA